MVAVSSVTVNKYHLDDRLIDFYASDDVSCCWKMCFYLLSNYFLTIWGINNALINVLKKLMQCVNALKQFNTLTALLIIDAVL